MPEHNNHQEVNFFESDPYNDPEVQDADNAEVKGVFEKIKKIGNSRIAKAFFVLASFYGNEAFGQTEGAWRRFENHGSQKTEQGSARTAESASAEYAQLKSQFDPESIDIIYKLDSVKNEIERKYLLEHSPQMSVHGFAKEGINSTEVLAFLRTLPRFLVHNLSELEFNDTLTNNPSPEYGIPSQSADGAIKFVTYAKTFPKLRKVVIMKATNGLDDKLKGIIVHELFHLADPENNRLLTLEERIELLKDSDDRANDEQEYKTNYVMHINNRNPRTQRTLKASEQLSELAKFYFSNNPNERMMISEKARAMFNKTLAKTDADWLAAHQ